MSIAEKNRIFLEKLRSLPEPKKKIILWAIVIVLAAIMGFFWVRGVINTVSGINQDFKKIEFPSMDISDMPKMPSLDILKSTTQSNENLVE